MSVPLAGWAHALHVLIRGWAIAGGVLLLAVASALTLTGCGLQNDSGS